MTLTKGTWATPVESLLRFSHRIPGPLRVFRRRTACTRLSVALPGCRRFAAGQCEHEEYQNPDLHGSSMVELARLRVSPFYADSLLAGRPALHGDAAVWVDGLDALDMHWWPGYTLSKNKSCLRRPLCPARSGRSTFTRGDRGISSHRRNRLVVEGWLALRRFEALGGAVRAVP